MAYRLALAYLVAEQLNFMLWDGFKFGKNVNLFVQDRYVVYTEGHLRVRHLTTLKFINNSMQIHKMLNTSLRPLTETDNKQMLKINIIKHSQPHSKLSVYSSENAQTIQTGLL